jgi:hypothetical protein
MYTKEQARYENPAMGSDHCRDCVFYTGGSCTKVEGAIAPSGWCMFYIEKAPMNSACSCMSTPCRCKDEVRTTLHRHEISEHDKMKSRTTGQDIEIKFGPQDGGNVPSNPFASLAQEGYMHAHPEKLGAKGLAEWDAATKGKHLPEHVKKAK